MKKIQNYLFFILLSALIAFSACDETIDDDDPGVEDREKFLGSWSTTETSLEYPQPITFTVTIEKDDNSAQIRLYNIYQLGTDVYAYALVTGNSFTIPNQNVSNMEIVDGYGEMVDDNTIELDYVINDGANQDTVTGQMKRNVPSLPAPVPARPNLALK